jgi:hypothetical protein
MAGGVSSVTEPTSVLSIVGGITFLAIIYALVTNAGGTASIINSLGGTYAGAIKAATAK